MSDDDTPPDVDMMNNHRSPLPSPSRQGNNAAPIGNIHGRQHVLRHRADAVNNINPRVHERNDGANDNLNEPHNAIPRRTQSPTYADQSLENSRYFRTIRPIKLADLISDDADDYDLDLKFIDAQLLRVIVAEKQSSVSFYYVRGKSGNNQGSQSNYRRLFLMRSTSSVEGDRLFYLLESASVNNIIWNRNTELRDNGTVTIGTIIRVLSPMPVQRLMAGNIPMVETRVPCVVMRPPSAGFNPIPIDYEIQGAAHRSFILTNAMVTLKRITPEATSCSGLFCDRQRVSDWMNMNRGCGCYSMITRRSSLVLVHSIKVDTRSGVSLNMGNFSSIQFSKIYLTTYIGSSVNVTSIRGTDHFLNIREAAIAAIDLINNNGGFTVIGWYKRGQINDRGLVEGSSNNGNGNKSANNDRVQVDNGDVNHNIVQIIPSNSDFCNDDTYLAEELAALKFNVSNLNLLVGDA